MKSKVATGVARRLLMTVAVIALAPAAFAQSSGADGTDPQSFFVLNNPGDPNFNQLLGINDGRIIVGYFGDGTVVANNGYVLVPKNHYSVENFTNLPSGDFASQTQAIGINNRRFPDIVGFWKGQEGSVRHSLAQPYRALKRGDHTHVVGIAHLYEEFADNHSGVDYRMDESLPFLAQALSG
jgi:hypothetical protein